MFSAAQVLVDVFKQVMETEMAKHGGGADADATDDTATGGEKKGGLAARQSPLSNFHMIVPGLTINFVETIRASKDRMVKTARGKEAYFTDDGFALGVAYVLAILRLTDQARGARKKTEKCIGDTPLSVLSGFA